MTLHDNNKTFFLKQRFFIPYGFLKNFLLKGEGMCFDIFFLYRFALFIAQRTFKSKINTCSFSLKYAVKDLYRSTIINYSDHVKIFFKTYNVFLQISRNLPFFIFYLFYLYFFCQSTNSSVDVVYASLSIHPH